MKRYNDAMAEIAGWKTAYDEVVAENNKICQTFDRMRAEKDREIAIRKEIEESLQKEIERLDGEIAALLLYKDSTQGLETELKTLVNKKNAQIEALRKG